MQAIYTPYNKREQQHNPKIVEHGPQHEVLQISAECNGLQRQKQRSF
jgi:hypothetical protein